MNHIMDFDDLRMLRVCESCKHVYLPEYKEDITAYPPEDYPVNDKLCVNCTKDEVKV